MSRSWKRGTDNPHGLIFWRIRVPAARRGKPGRAAGIMYQPVDFGMVCADARLHCLVSQNEHELFWQLC
jgi:hypothetical protein